ncbi:MAG TPA: hypothetical protein VGP25_03185 [Gemmatimonadaceae bacterium]|jgi:hypothetical protein|nr:hypothetical protein [Gemmatimonadaceae bacterium]
MDDSRAPGGVKRSSGPLAVIARALLSALVGRPMSIPATVLACYPELAEARWRRGGLPVRVGGWCLGRATVSGITLGRTIWLAPRAPLAPELLLHELRHVHQFAADRAFPLRYVWRSLRRGYARNEYEADANAYAASRAGGSSPTV